MMTEALCWNKDGGKPDGLGIGDIVPNKKRARYEFFFSAIKIISAYSQSKSAYGGLSIRVYTPKGLQC